ncbi:hypothetical protein [Corallococcus silvisoli]|uniref:hypothetical protein n=1 Tax=Corallococcus silvisoli TaxID=2697031 RepID=UPI0013767182|nr:hypothetical protein [Corallococcus silvisoli]NBD12941.1 hypothetical protein [Corallococcus silvisoli]
MIGSQFSRSPFPASGAIIVLSLTACGTFKSDIIQAPTPEEQLLSKQLSDARPGKTFTAACADDDIDKNLGSEAHARICNKEPDLFLKDSFRSSDQFCRNIVTWGQDSYQAGTAWGIIFGIVGLTSATTGATLIATSDSSKDLSPKIALTAGGAIVTAIGFIFLGRASAAATASGEAGLAFIPGLSDEDRWKTCLAARAKWLGANAEATRVAFPSAAPAKTDDSSKK